MKAIAVRTITGALLSALVWLAGPRVAEAGVDVWTTNGPEGGTVSALAIDPLAPTILYAGTQSGGVFKSTDGGGTWSATGLTSTYGSVLALAIHPQTPTTLYAGTQAGGVFKSLDGGGTWGAVNTGLTNPYVNALAIDPVTPTTLFASTQSGGVFKSLDGGGTWSATGLTNTSAYVLALAIDPLTPTTLYAGTWAGVFKSTDGGGTWSAVNTGLTNTPVSTLAIDPLTPTTLFAGTQSGGVFESLDGGGTWSAVNTGLTNPYVNVLAIDPLTPTTVYAGTQSGGVFKSLDGGDTWSAVNAGLTSPYVKALAIHPQTPTTLYAGTQSGGAFKSLDGGGTWSAVNTGLTSPYVKALAIDSLTPTTLYAGTQSGGVFKSINGGGNWNAVNTGLTSPYVKALAIHPQTPTTLFAGTYGASLFKSLDGGGTWSATGLTYAHVLVLAIDPRAPTTLYAGTDGGGVFKSTDGGSTWSAVNAGLTTSQVRSLAIDPQTPTTLYAGTNGGGVFKSLDGGGTWSAVNAGLINLHVNTMAINPQAPTTLYAGTSGGGVFKSTDGGGTWGAVNTGLTNTSVLSLAIDPPTPTTLFAGTDGGGAFKSTDGGGNWSPLNSGLTTPYVNVLAIDPQTPTTLYAGTPIGVFAIEQRDTTPPTVALTSPSNGATVSGTIPVAASAADAQGVAAVRFLLDGAPLGPEDTTVPYEATWDTRTVPDGTHTITALARDAAGNSATSAPVTVTVANATRFEETAATLAPAGAWSETTSASAGVTLSGDRAVFASEAGATVTFTFTGTRVSWIGFPCESCGIVNVGIDGSPVATVDTFAATRPAASGVMFTASGLAAGTHTLVIEVTGTANPSSSGAFIVVDALDVTAANVSRFEETAATVAPAGAWFETTSASTGVTLSGDRAVFASEAGATATFTFTGTRVSWIGFPCESCGIANVRIDGSPVATVDTFAATRPAASGVMFTASELATGTHTLVIEVTGTANPSSSGAFIGVDSLDVTAAEVTRFEETAATPAPAGAWFETTSASAGVTLSGDRAVFASEAGATATFTFTGTRVSWIGFPCESCGITNVRIDGSPVATVDTFAAARPAASGVMFTASGLAAGTHTLGLEVTGTANPSSSGAFIVVDALDVTDGGPNPPPSDTTPPTVAMTAPSGGATVAGTVFVSATASDDVGVTGVQLLLDGAPLAAEDTTAPYEATWDTRTVPDGTHTLTARARDAAGNSATSAPVTVTVANRPGARVEETAATAAPSAAWLETTSASTGVTLSGDRAIFASEAGATATFTFTGTGVSWIGFPCELCGIANARIDGTHIATVDTFAATRPAASGVLFTASGLAAGTHTLVIEVTGTANPSSSAAFIVVDAFDVTTGGPNPPPSDTTPPTVAMTAPSDGTTVSGTIPVSASASDNVGVTAVQFLLDGAPLGAEDTIAPYEATWDTRTAPNGTHTLTARARDAAGNSATSAPVTVTVFNDTTPPTVAMTAPSDGTTVSGTTPVSASASDDVGVTGVQFLLDGAPLGAEDTMAPYEAMWDTRTVPNGTHTLTARARDVAGNSATSAPVTVTVFNDTTPPTVTITSPTSGSTVTGTTTVSADAADNVGIVGVQFKLDGADLGVEDTAAPYSISWDTTTASDGSHTLTAVARDAAGNLATSEPVTVTVSNAPPPPPPATVTRFEENDPSITYTDGWTQGHTGRAWSGGTAALSTAATAQATFAFTGTSVSWIGFRGPQTGIARVLLDGVFVREVDTYSTTEEVRAVVFTATGLAAASHTLTIEVTGLKNAASTNTIIVVDAFDVPAPMVTRFQEKDPSITYTAGWTQGDTGRAWSGGAAALSTAATAQATFSFTGTSVSWIGLRGPQTGIARVLLDGVLVREIDTYSTTEEVQAAVFTATGLAAASHTLTIEVTGLKNAASTDTVIVVDAFEVTSSSPAPTGTRFEETDPSITYTAGWTQGDTGRAWSSGFAAFSTTAGAQATFTFTGTSVRWIGFRGPQTGIARVFLDGALVTEVDTFSTTEEVRAVVFTATGLAGASHTLMIEVTGRTNPAATNTFIVVDAFDVYN